MKLLTCILFSLVTSACTKNPEMTEVPVPNQDVIVQNPASTASYLALGDSYTIGESVPRASSFPFQLKNLLNNANKSIADPKIIATTGWTTDELQQAIVQAKITQKFDFVTLLIGVNNQYRNYPIDTYKKEFSELLQTAIAFANGDKSRVFVVSIPDWGVTPFGHQATKTPQTIAAEIDAFNLANREITLAAGVSYTDITPGSRKAETDLSLVAGDGLHPSAKMYADWANALLPKVAAVLK